MDISKSINQKVEDLKQAAEKLSKIKIKWENPISLICNQIHIANYKDIHFPLVEHRTIPSVYYFKIVNQIPLHVIQHSFSNYKERKIRNCSFIDKKRKENSTILYCGSVGKELHGRLVQHLGFGSAKTGGLQLIHWAKDLNLELEFHYAWLGQENRDYTVFIESALANHLDPLIGKKA